MHSSKQPKLVHLGGRPKIHSPNKENQINKLMSGPKTNAYQFQTPYSMSKPIVIRYIDPRIVPLFVELGKITKMVENIVSCSQGGPSGQQKEEIQTLIRSTKEINEKVSIIMQENSASLSASSGFGNIVNKTDLVKSQYEYQALRKSKLKQSCIVESQLECSALKLESNINADQIDMVAILNRVAQRLQELQSENLSLKVQLALQKTKSVQLQKQKVDLSQTLKQKDTMDKVKISQLQQQLTSLTNNSSVISTRIAKLNLLISE